MNGRAERVREEVGCRDAQHQKVILPRSMQVSQVHYVQYQCVTAASSSFVKSILCPWKSGHASSFNIYIYIHKFNEACISKKPFYAPHNML